MVRGALMAAGLIAMTTGTDAAHQAEVAAWHKGRIERLTGESGWLTLVGLHWLKEGVHDAGSEPGQDIVMTKSAPPKLGTFVVKEGRVTFAAAPGVAVTDGKEPVHSAVMRSDAEGTPTLLRAGTLSFHIVKRGERLGVRVKDSDAPARRDFKGIQTFPVSAAWRFEARFEPFAKPKKVKIPTVLNTVEEMESPGFVVFKVGGKEHRLEAIIEAGGDELFFIFADKTSGKETYGAGRFLYTPMPKDGRVVVDFNRAYNPPCAFTPFATCPLPPPHNRLAIRVEAGEKKYGDH